jgi:hypothetical protein
VLHEAVCQCVTEREQARRRFVKAANQFPEDWPGYRICFWFYASDTHLDNPTSGFLNRSGQAAEDKNFTRARRAIFFLYQFIIFTIQNPFL